MHPTPDIVGPLQRHAFKGKRPVLDLARERELARRWQHEGDRGAADELLRAHLHSVVALAAKYRNYGVPISELVAEGNCGLVHALRKFDPERGVRFATYAIHWVRAYMLGYVVRSWSIVTGASGLMRSRMFFKFRRERARLTAVLGEGETTTQALAERLGVPPERVKAMMNRLDSQDVSLDLPAFRDSAIPLVERLLSSANPEQDLLDATFRGSVGPAVQAALGALDARERYVVESRLMAETGEELSLAELGKLLGVSRERVRQLELRAKRKLRALVDVSGDPVVAEWAAAAPR